MILNLLIINLKYINSIRKPKLYYINCDGKFLDIYAIPNHLFINLR